MKEIVEKLLFFYFQQNKYKIIKKNPVLILRKEMKNFLSHFNYCRLKKSKKKEEVKNNKK